IQSDFPMNEFAQSKKLPALQQNPHPSHLYQTL
ncbi:uncharacterized protein METZ01_LOCUS267810, partial [marine metagenome]